MLLYGYFVRSRLSFNRVDPRLAGDPYVSRPRPSVAPKSECMVPDPCRTLPACALLVLESDSCFHCMVFHTLITLSFFRLFSHVMVFIKYAPSPSCSPHLSPFQSMSFEIVLLFRNHVGMQAIRTVMSRFISVRTKIDL